LKTYPEDLFESIEFDLVKQAVSKRAVTERARDEFKASNPVVILLLLLMTFKKSMKS